MIDIKVKKGRGDRPIGTVQVENLTTEEEAVLYGKCEVNKSFTQVHNIDISLETFKILNPFDYITLKSDKRGWEGENIFASGVSYVIDDQNFFILNVNGESYLPFEENKIFVEEAVTGYILREDASYILREDGNRFVRE
ncbi:hypothetical protein M0R19_06345 [Candidatus Pacearchaeota archaeon]|nr:hypothetical protein [Candidatus Pacearchaeota archaeon]